MFSGLSMETETGSSDKGIFATNEIVWPIAEKQQWNRMKTIMKQEYFLFKFQEFKITAIKSSISGIVHPFSQVDITAFVIDL